MEIQKHMSPLSVWSFSVGTSIGWGSFFITSNTYLINAGPLGSISGLLLGCFVMLFIAHNYQFMMNRFSDSGGVFTYTKNVLGCDYAFLTAVFLILTYFAIFWANATSIPLFARYFSGDFFKFGPLYSLFEYKIYFGEALLSILAIFLTGFVCSRHQKTASVLMTVLVLFFTAGILI